MSGLLAWLGTHWLSLILIIGCIIAFLYVTCHKDSLQIYEDENSTKTPTAEADRES
jgi:hypothetical protein